MLHVQRAFKAFAYRTLQNSNVKSPNWRFWRQRKRTTINLINYHSGEREWWLGEYMWKCLTIFFFHLIEKFRACVKGEDHGGEMLSRCAGLENSSVATIGWSVIWQDSIYKNMSLDWTGPSRPPTVIRDVHNEILVKAKAAGELVPKWSGLHHS